MPFTLDVESLEKLYKEKTGKDTGHTVGTLKQYKTYLNKLATAGFDDTNKLIKNQKKVLDVVKALDAKYHKSAMNAIFYALSDKPNDKKTKGHYYNYFQELKSGDKTLNDYKASLLEKD